FVSSDYGDIPLGMKWLAEIESAIDRERPARRALRRGRSNAPKASRRGRGDPGRARLPEGLWQADVAAQQLGVARPPYQKMLAAAVHLVGPLQVCAVQVQLRRLGTSAELSGRHARLRRIERLPEHWTRPAC